MAFPLKCLFTKSCCLCSCWLNTKLYDFFGFGFHVNIIIQKIRIKAAWKIKHEKTEKKYKEGVMISNTSSNDINKIKNKNFH